MIEHVHLQTGAHELRRDVGLQVGETQHEVGLESDDALDLRAGERGDFRLFLARAWRAHGEAGDTDDAPLLTEEIQGLRCLLGQAYDPLRKSTT